VSALPEEGARLEQAGGHIAAAKRRIRAQQALIETLRANDAQETRARALLDAMQATWISSRRIGGRLWGRSRRFVGRGRGWRGFDGELGVGEAILNRARPVLGDSGCASLSVIFMAALSPLNSAMNAKDEQFFKALGARIASARKTHELTQQQLAEQLGIAQQTLAH
jgi:hypothetical protein